MLTFRFLGQPLDVLYFDCFESGFSSYPKFFLLLILLCAWFNIFIDSRFQVPGSRCRDSLYEFPFKGLNKKKKEKKKRQERAMSACIQEIPGVRFCGWGEFIYTPGSLGRQDTAEAHELGATQCYSLGFYSFFLSILYLFLVVSWFYGCWFMGNHG